MSNRQKLKNMSDEEVEKEFQSDLVLVFMWIVFVIGLIVGYFSGSLGTAIIVWSAFLVWRAYRTGQSYAEFRHRRETYKYWEQELQKEEK